MKSKTVPRWSTSWPEWFGIFDNVTVVPAEDYDRLLASIKSNLPSGMAELVIESAGLTSSGPAAQAGDKSGTAPTASVPADVLRKITGVTRAFDYPIPERQHIPWVKVEFAANDWDSRDAFANAIALPSKG